MSKLPSATGAEAIQAFARIGFVQVRSKGSHRVLKKPDHAYVLTIPVHKTQPLKKGTLRQLIRGAGITVEAFAELLRH